MSGTANPCGCYKGTTRSWGSLQAPRGRRRSGKRHSTVVPATANETDYAHRASQPGEGAGTDASIMERWHEKGVQGPRRKFNSVMSWVTASTSHGGLDTLSRLRDEGKSHRLMLAVLQTAILDFGQYSVTSPESFSAAPETAAVESSGPRPPGHERGSVKPCRLMQEPTGHEGQHRGCSTSESGNTASASTLSGMVGSASCGTGPQVRAQTHPIRDQVLVLMRTVTVVQQQVESTQELIRHCRNLSLSQAEHVQFWEVVVHNLMQIE